jgi:hypothetical protein
VRSSQPYELVVTPPAARAIRGTLPENVAAAVVEFLTGAANARGPPSRRAAVTGRSQRVLACAVPGFPRRGPRPVLLGQPARLPSHHEEATRNARRRITEFFTRYLKTDRALPDPDLVDPADRHALKILSIGLPLASSSTSLSR